MGASMVGAETVGGGGEAAAGVARRGGVWTEVDALRSALREKGK